MSLIGRNIVWLLISQLATWGATLVTLVFVPESLGSTDFGAYAYAVGYVMFFTLAAGLGTSTYLSRAIARDEGLIGPYVWNAVLLKLVLSTTLAMVAFGLAYLLGNRGDTLAMIAIGCAGMLFYTIGEVFAGALAGLQRMARPAMWTVIQVYIQTVAGITVLALGWGVVAYAAVMTVASIIPGAAMALMVRPLVRGHRRFEPSIWRILVVGGLPLLALSFFNLIYGTVNVPILHNIAGSDPVGWFVLAMRWVGIPIFITTAVVSAYFPAFSQHGKPLTPEFAPLVNRAIHIVLFVTVPAGFGIALVADDLIPMLYRGGEYNSSVILIQVMGALTPISALDTVLGTALVAADRVNRYLIIAGTAAALNPIACVLLINYSIERWDNGAIGAALAMVATELWVLTGGLRLRSPGVMDRPSIALLLRVLAATAVMSVVVILSGSLPLVAQVLLGVASYAVASLAFGAISFAELTQVVAQAIPSLRRNGDDRGIGGKSVHDEAGIG